MNQDDQTKKKVFYLFIYKIMCIKCPYQVAAELLSWETCWQYQKEAISIWEGASDPICNFYVLQLIKRFLRPDSLPCTLSATDGIYWKAKNEVDYGIF